MSIVNSSIIVGKKKKPYNPTKAPTKKSDQLSLTYIPADHVSEKEKKNVVSPQLVKHVFAGWIR